MPVKIGNTKLRIAIVGAGPAGSSLAVRLAGRGHRVTLLDRDTFPRHKLCGEFISPECLRHFDELGVFDDMLAAGGERVYETRFFDRRGRNFAVPSSLLDGGGFALSLSRYEMDRRLLDRARTMGVDVLEGVKVSQVLLNGGRAVGLETARNNRSAGAIEADLFIDATGRNMALTRLAGRETGEPKTANRKPLAVGFKAHFRGARPKLGSCEIFAFPGGYGGLTRVENGLANLCFLMRPGAAKWNGGSGDDLVREAVCKNARASSCLESAVRVGDWHAVSIGSFGKARESAVTNLFSIGDSAAFIDPFTGSGMLMALESSALLAKAIETASPDLARIRQAYNASFDTTFSRRLSVCSALRRIAFVPMLPTLAISLLSLSSRARGRLAASTRSAAAVYGPERRQ